MKRIYAATITLTALAACGEGNPFGQDTPVETTGGVVDLSEQNSDLTANSVTYNAASDTITINNIPFDDGDNEYIRITTEAFANGYDAYQSDPAPGSNEDQYFAIFRRSDSGQSQVAATTSEEYVGFGFGGAVAQRLGSAPNLPSSGVYTYSGEYGAVRTVLDANGASDRVEYVTGDAELVADFGDFDNIGAVGGTIENRVLYDEAGLPVGNLDGFISLVNGNIDFANGSIEPAQAVEFDGTRVQRATGNWTGVFAGPNGEEISGILFVDGLEAREVGTMVTTQ